MKLKPITIASLFFFSSCDVANAQPIQTNHQLAASRGVVPPERPRLDASQVRGWVPSELLGANLVVVVSRGFFAGQVRGPLGGLRGSYSDAFFIVGSKGVEGYRGSSFPSNYGFNAHPAVRNYFPVTEPGIIRGYTLSTYVSYSGVRREALVDGITTVVRDQGLRETGNFRILFHAGGITPGSFGCFVLPPEDAASFFATLRSYKATEIPVVLIEVDSPELRQEKSRMER